MNTMIGFFVLALFCSMTLSVNAATGVVSMSIDPNDPNACYRASDKLSLKVGEEKHMPDCSVLSCSKTVDKLTLQIRSCGVLVKPTDPDMICKTTTESGKPYPQCCPQLDCSKKG